MLRTSRQPDHTEQRHLYDLPLVVLTGAVLVEIVVPGVSASLTGWPLVISLFLIGMPHGAIDFSLTAQMTASKTTHAYLCSFSGYAVILLASLAFFLMAPATALILFLLLSATHFGLADARSLDARFAVATTPWLRTLSAATRGVFVIALPFVFWPDESRKVFADIVAIAGHVAPTVAPATFSSLATVVVSFALLSHAVVTTSRVRAGQAEAAAVEALETAVVWLAFFMLHPLFATGLYFLAWHSWRHLLTLLRLESFSPAGRTTQHLVTAIYRLHVRSLPLLLPTLGIFAAVAWWRLEVWSVDLLAALTIAFFVVVTLPHHLLIERLITQPSADEEQHEARVADLAVADGKIARDRGSHHAPLNTA